jgi:hydrogenase/urease accessory protein HupE
LLLLLAIAIGGAMPVRAHEIRPAYLQIREIGPSTYDLVWKTPAQGDLRLALNVILPPTCRNVGPARTTVVGGAVVQRWRSACEGELRGQRVIIENLETSLTDVILRFAPLAGAARTLRLDGAAPAVVIPAAQSRWEVAGGYFRMGVEHILFGIDHLLFVFCLLLLVGDLKPLLGAVTAFTLAHSITLGGTTLGGLHLATAPVEACIALSIALVAAEIVKAHRGRTGFTQRWPWLAAFAFGLLHGFGFAAALRDIGLPDGAIPLALLFFNLGVEAGQILFVGIVLAIVFGWRKYARPPSGWVRSAPAYFAGVVACFWFFERALHILL